MRSQPQEHDQYLSVCATGQHKEPKVSLPMYLALGFGFSVKNIKVGSHCLC